MSTKKYLIPAALVIGAVSMMGLQVFAQSTPTTTQNQPMVQTATQPADDQNKGTDIETNDDGVQAAQNDVQDPTQADGETND